MAVEIGALLKDRYRIDALLGEGGMGAVYRAFDTLHDTLCAVKEFRLGYLPTEAALAPAEDGTHFKTPPTTREKALEQFKREARLLARLEHPNLPKVSDYFLEGSDYYLVMTLIEGRDLAVVLDQNGNRPFAWRYIAPWVEQLLDVLSYCHGKDVIHRDIKPANAILTGSGQAYLVDFGIAKFSDPTGRTVMAATPGYSPPEQYGVKGRTDKRSDIYAFGALLYTLLTGQQPEDAQDRLLSKHEGSDALEPDKCLPVDLPAPVAAAIIRALALSANDRFQTAAELQAALFPAAKPVAKPAASEAAVPGQAAAATPAQPAAAHVEAPAPAPEPQAPPAAPPASAPGEPDQTPPKKPKTLFPHLGPRQPAEGGRKPTPEAQPAKPPASAEQTPPASAGQAGQQPAKPPAAPEPTPAAPQVGAGKRAFPTLVPRTPPAGAVQPPAKPAQPPVVSVAKPEAGGAAQPPVTPTPPPAAAKPAAAPAVVRWVTPERASLTLAPGVELLAARIPAGEFLMGSDKGRDPQAFDNELPQSRLHLPEYWLGVTPVTVAQFQVFVDATHYQTTAEVQGVAWIWNLLAKRWAVGKGAYWRAPQGPGSSVKAKTGHPVTQVSWDDAQAFCRWLSSLSGLTCRLPSEAEWEKAARGTDGRIYPWGNALPDETRCNYGQKVGGTMPCGHYSPRSDAPYGCQDMAGNVWEWTSSLWGNDWGQPDFKYPYQAGDGRENPQSRDRRVLRGGSLHYGVVQMRSACRDRYPPDSRLDDTGFRVCCVGLPGRD